MLNKNIYNKRYARQWMEYEKSGQDVLRQKFLYPYLQQAIEEAVLPMTPSRTWDIRIGKQSHPTLLDIGCGWGGLLDYINEEVVYVGIDPIKSFIAFIWDNYSDRRMGALEGNLPDNIWPDKPYDPAPLFDIVVCSMALHCVSDLETSVNALFSKAKNGGKVIIAEFNDQAPPIIRKTFLRIDKDTGNYIKGRYNLSNRVSIIAEAYFHGEEQIEKAIRAHSDFRKTLVGPMFVGYEAEKGKFL